MHFAHVLSSCLSSLLVLLFSSLKVYGGNIYMELYESLVLPRYYSWDIIKTKEASHGLTETRQKGHWKNNVPRRGKRKIHTLWDRWTCANGKEWSRGTNEVLAIELHMVGNSSMEFDLEAPLKTQIKLENRGALLFFLIIFFSFSFVFFFLNRSPEL